MFIQIELLPEDMLDENFFIKFAQFEERHHEMERLASVCSYAGV